MLSLQRSLLMEKLTSVQYLAQIQISLSITRKKIVPFCPIGVGKLIITLVKHPYTHTLPGRSDLGSGSCQGVLQHQDHGVAPQEHLGDESVLVDRLGFLLPFPALRKLAH